MRLMSYSVSLLVLSAGATASMANIFAQLNTGALPSAQPGWRFEALASDVGTPESAVFSTDGTILTSNSMDLPFASNRAGTTHAIYDFAQGTIQSDSIVEMNLTARIIASEVAVFNYGFSISVYGDGRGMSTGFSTNVLSLDAEQNIAFDTTGWNDYRMVGDWAAETWTLYVNGQELTTRSLRSLAAEYASIGDGTGTANAHAEVSHFSVRIVPAPGAVAVLAGAGLVATRRRR